MQVTSNCPGRRRLKRPPLAAVLMLALAGFAGVAQAVEFDEKLKAPMMKSAAEWKTQAQAFATKYRDVRAATPRQLISNPSLAGQQFDLTWQLEQAINERRPLTDIESMGFTPKGDGSYVVDYAKNPEWRAMADIVSANLSSNLLDSICEALLVRGFRPEDVSILKAYVAAHDANAAVHAATLPPTLGFGRVVKKFDNAGRPVPDALVISHWYQNTRIVMETNRAWVDGLLNALDAQRARVLLSFFTNEVQGSLLLSPESVDAAIGQTLAAVRLPDFEQRVSMPTTGGAP
jgi:hypothetical protein